MRRALGGSPSVVAADATLKSRNMATLAAYTPYLPTVRITGGYDWFAYDFPPHQQSWSLRVTASLPLFNGFQREASLQRARAAQRTAEAQARDAELGARVSVESAVAVDRGRGAARGDLRPHGALAEEDLRVQEERYQLGVTTILDLQASQVALADAQVSAVTARQALGKRGGRARSDPRGTDCPGVRTMKAMRRSATLTVLRGGHGGRWRVAPVARPPRPEPTRRAGRPAAWAAAASRASPPCRRFP